MARNSLVVSFAALALVLLLVGSSMALGTLWVNQIWGNSDTHYVNVEDVRIDDNTMYVDFVNQLGTNGVSVENTIFQAGSVHVPVNLNVDQVGTVTGRLNANGGIYADDAVNGGYSFTVEDNTGVTTISGELRPNGGINVNQGRFTVSTTGETIIDTAPLRPNGGIDSNYGQFTVSKDDGSVLTKGQLTVQQDIVLGTNTEENRSLRRVPTTSRNGGNTYIKGQDGIVNGGNLELLPGYASIGTSHGQIVFGRAAPDDLLITRADSTAAGGTTTYAGQSSSTAAGGDLLLVAGTSSTTSGAGGNLWLIPGTSVQGGLNGDILLGGSNDATQPEFDLVVRRPDATVLNAGSTTFAGQTSTSGNGGDIVIAAGNGATSGTVNPTGPFGGDVVLQPGIAANVLGKIVLGRNDNDDLFVTRLPSVDDAGTTYFKGQDSSLGRGGDVRIIAGDAATDPAANSANAPVQNGGDIHLVTGLAANNGVPGIIYWGVKTQALEVRRETQAAAAIGTDTSIFGQNSGIGRGGDLNLFSGLGSTGSGNLVVQVPSVAGSTPGTISVLAGDTDVVNARGGDVRILAGVATDGSGGVVSITAGSATTGGNIYLQAGAGGVPANNGQVIVKSGASLFLVDQAPVIIDNADLVLQRSASEVVRLSANPNSILTVNGKVILKSRITQTIAGDASSIINLAGPLTSTTATDQYLQDLQHSLNGIIRALSPCGHGLFNVYDPTNNAIVSDSTSLFCTQNLNKRRSLSTVSATGYDPLATTNRAVIKCGINSQQIATPVALSYLRNAANSAATSRNDGLGTSDDQPPLWYLVNDPNQRKCLLYNDAVSGPEHGAGAAADTVTTSQGVLAAGFVSDVATETTKY